MEIEQILSLSEEDLYVLLVPEYVKRDAYSKDGLLAQGKNIFWQLSSHIKKDICSFYTLNKDYVDYSTEFLAVLCAFIKDLGTVPIDKIVPFSVLLLKVGLHTFCKK
jgi:hypothetical protein